MYSTSFDATLLDKRHELFCPGCPDCEAEEERWERHYNRHPELWV